MEFRQEISFADLQRELGRAAAKNVKNIAIWIDPRNKDGMEGRVAPSLVTRSDAEVFSISAPRFAKRIHLRLGGFFNVRRLVQLSHAAQNTHGNYFKTLVSLLPGNRSRTLTRGEIRNAIETPRCIADSLLQLPPRFENEYSAIGVKRLTLAYGEKASLELTPYIQHIAIGGQCAQACCLMTLSMLESHARSIMGISEVVEFVRDNEPTDTDGTRSQILEGMYSRNIENFFQNDSVNLHAARQFDYRTDVGSTLFALRSYIESGIPVIVPVDAGRLRGYWKDAPKSIFKQNGLNDGDLGVPTRSEAHTVVVVGVSKRKDSFLINDPSTFPFLEISIEDLIKAQRYEKEHGPETSKPKLAGFEIIPVTPKGVDNSLLAQVEGSLDKQYKRHRTGRRSIGLVSVIESELESPSYQSVNERVGPINIGLRETELRLVDCRSDTSFPVPPGIEDRIRQLRNSGWLWVHSISNNCPAPFKSLYWAWSASRDSYTSDSSDLLLVLGETESGEVQAIYTSNHIGFDTPTSNSEADSTPSSVNMQNLKVSVVSSFDVEGFLTGRSMDVFRYMNTSCGRKAACELYLLMEQDSIHLPEGFHSRKRNAVDMLGRLSTPDMQKLVNHVSSLVGECQTDIVALASFVPGVSKPPKSPAAKRARRCLKSLAKMSHMFRTSDHNVSTIEMVSGSRVEGIEKPKDAHRYAIRIASQEAVLKNLLANMRDVANYVRNNGIDVCFAIELEPGPYFVVRDEASLVEICRNVEKCELLSKYVGLNLDIAHWRLAGIDPNSIARNAVIRNRVVHAHIGGHHTCGHIGDISPLQLNSEDDYVEWLDLLSKIASEDRPTECPKFSGYLSLEMEAARSVEVVKKGVRETVDLLGTET